MLARLQQFTTLGILALAALWGGWAWRAGHPAWAVAGVLALLCGHALVLGLEFVLLRWVHGDDPAPRAGLKLLLRAWWGEVLAAPRVFCWRQPFRSRRWPDVLPALARGQRGVLLVHGFVCNRGLWNPWLEKLHAAGTPVVAVNLEPVFGAIDDYVARIEDGVRALEQATGLAPVVVGHSMGGLALRRWWAELGGDGRVYHAITIGTPHHGTWLARWALSANARQMRIGSPWLQALEAREPHGRAAKLSCFYSHCDNIVFPPSTATLAGADNRHLVGVAHVHMADRPEPWQELQRWLRR
ncbi:Permease [Rubrivivax sp. A210]|uniref:esterase/lipase family protein n=1 Tax=Rubrivivax sp. A210 TaxID=2772301 RepID=UPI001918B007|nr:permease [Rubrivivax sp. A210]CAD5374063.1 Permease [Rubrivivax sp. A210]